MGKMKHFYNTSDFKRGEINKLINLALDLKKGKIKKSLKGKTLAMLFFNPSLRTRISFMCAMVKLGGNTFDLSEGKSYTFEYEDGTVMDKNTIEHVKDGARALSKYCDAIGIRSSDLVTNSAESKIVEDWEKVKKDKVLHSFMKYASVPVINMESNVYHPCQGLADAVTIVEKLALKTPSRKKYVLTWVPHPKALPMATPNSQILAACDLGLNVVVVHPPQWELDKEIMSIAAKRAKEAEGSLVIDNNQEKALKDADFVCVKSWGSLKYYGNWEEEQKIRNGLKNWIVDKEKMNKTNNAIFMHCLPVRRNVEVTDEVLDGKNSVVIDQAENRLWVQMAILLELL